MHLLHDHKQPDSFHSGRWNTTSNPDLAFVNLDGPAPSRIILDHFPKSQHRPSLIISESPISSIPSKPVKRWKFRKANWSHFESLVDSGVDNLPPSSAANNVMYYLLFIKHCPLKSCILWEYEQIKSWTFVFFVRFFTNTNSTPFS